MTQDINLYSALRNAFPQQLDAVAIETDSGLKYSWRDIDRAIAQRGVALVPPLRPGYDPPGGTLVLVPAIVWAGQPATLRPPAMRLSGMRLADPRGSRNTTRRLMCAIATTSHIPTLRFHSAMNFHEFL